MVSFINKHSLAVQAVCAVCFGFTATMFGWKTVIAVTYVLDRFAQ